MYENDAEYRGRGLYCQNNTYWCNEHMKGKMYCIEKDRECVYLCMDCPKKLKGPFKPVIDEELM